MNNYSSRIKRILNDRELSVIDFCRLIGLNSPSTIHLLIKENRKPSGKTVDRILKAFPEYTKDWLLYGIQEKKEFDNDDLTLTAKQVIDFIKNKSHSEILAPLITGYSMSNDEIEAQVKVLRSDAITRIKDLKELLDMGIITQDEFDSEAVGLKKIILSK